MRNYFANFMINKLSILVIILLISYFSNAQEKPELPNLEGTIDYILNNTNSHVRSIGAGPHDGKLVNGYMVYPTKYDGEIVLSNSECQIIIDCTDTRYSTQKSDKFIINLDQLNYFSSSYHSSVIIKTDNYGIEHHRSKGGVKYPNEIQINFYMGMSNTTKRVSKALTHASELCGVEYYIDPFSD